MGLLSPVDSATGENPSDAKRIAPPGRLLFELGHVEPQYVGGCASEAPPGLGRDLDPNPVGESLRCRD